MAIASTAVKYLAQTAASCEHPHSLRLALPLVFLPDLSNFPCGFGSASRTCKIGSTTENWLYDRLTAGANSLCILQLELCLVPAAVTRPAGCVL